MSARVVVAGLSAAVLMVLATGGAVAGPEAHGKATVTVVATGLDNPRDLAFNRHGKLFVAEAGHGGTHCATTPEGTACFGFTSGVSRVNLRRHRAHRIAFGLVSSAAPDGTGATGLDGISSRHRKMFGIIAMAPQKVPDNAFGSKFERRLKGTLGRLVRFIGGGATHRVASVGQHDYRWSNQHKYLVPSQFPDANPYGVLAARHGRYVVDAGANTLDWVNRRGRVHVLKFIPSPPSTDAVPTCIARGPDHALYIGELTGAGNPPGSSTVWRYAPWSGQLRIWATGLTAVTGCGFSGGRFYATEFSTNGLDNAAPGTGAVVRVRPNSAMPKTIVSGLNFPGGFASRHHKIYVSNWSILPSTAQGGGQVLRIKLGS